MSEGKPAKSVAKRCKAKEDANRYYLWLCSKYNSVQLVKAPRFTEEGVYVWAVRGKQ